MHSYSRCFAIVVFVLNHPTSRGPRVGPFANRSALSARPSNMAGSPIDQSPSIDQLARQGLLPILRLRSIVFRSSARRNCAASRAKCSSAARARAIPPPDFPRAIALARSKTMSDGPPASFQAAHLLWQGGKYPRRPQVARRNSRQVPLHRNRHPAPGKLSPGSSPSPAALNACKLGHYPPPLSAPTQLTCGFFCISSHDSAMDEAQGRHVLIAASTPRRWRGSIARQQ